MSKYKKVRVTGYIIRECKYCKQNKELINLEITHKDNNKESVSYCADCLRELYGLDFRRQQKKQ